MMNCGDVQRLADRFLALDLEREAETDVRDHVRGCGACREMLAAREPAQVVAWLGDAPSSGEDDAFVGEVMAGIHQRRLGRRLGAPRRYLALAAAVLVAVAAGTMAARRLLAPAAPTVARLTPVVSAPATREPVSHRPAFVEVDKAGVRLYQLTQASDSRDAVQVAFIVDPHVEL